jgi:TRIAP1/MDM35 family protein
MQKYGRLMVISTEYLRGTATSDECEPLFAKYKQCLSVSSGLSYSLSLPFTYNSLSNKSHVWKIQSLVLIYSQRALKDRGIDKMLDEARADNRENDLENMKPGSG